MNRERARIEHFVRGLFRNVLDLKDAPEGWIQPWIDRAFVIGDPITIFEEFVSQAANVDRLARVDDAETHWPTGHFYSPVVRRSEAEADWARLSVIKPPERIDLRAQHQAEMLTRLALHFDSIPFSDDKTAGLRYHYTNPSYNFGDALIYWSMLHTLKPRRILEVGSGFSSALALDAIDLAGMPTQCAFIDPYPEVAEAATAPLGPAHRIIASRLQDVDLGLVQALAADDILFIDSSHVAKTGSDVCFYLKEVLPIVPSGVVVHFHDIFYPFEYPAAWAITHNHSWNELYLIEAFLMFNSDYVVEFFNDFVAKTMADRILQLSPRHGGRFLINPGGGLWLRRV